MTALGEVRPTHDEATADDIRAMCAIVGEGLKAGALGFSGIAAGAAGIAKILFVLFLVAFVAVVAMILLGVSAVRK